MRATSFPVQYNFKFLSEYSNQTLLVAAVSLAVLLIAVITYAARRRSSSRGSLALLVGPSDAGKTAILSTLAYHQTLPTHTSLQVNSAVVSSASGQREHLVVDVPGHPRIRDQFKEYIPDAKAVVFVVDASTISRNGPLVAEHLHEILHALVSLPPTSSLPPLAILAHKSDLLHSAPSTSLTQSKSRTGSGLAISRVTTILERELEKRRASQVGGVAVEGLGAEDESTDLGGLECRKGGSFKFSEWEGGEIIFMESSVKPGSEEEKSDNEKTEEDTMVKLREWLDELP